MNEKEMFALSADGGFLQSDYWRAFQESLGHRGVHIESDSFWGNGVVHHLPAVGEYLYFPRGPVVAADNQEGVEEAVKKLIDAAKETQAKWVRIEPKNEDDVEKYRKYFKILQQAQDKNLTIIKAPHDMQPREILVMDITGDAEALLAGMKSKTRYNIGIAEKKGVKVFATREKKYQDEFFKLIAVTAKRKEITPHPKAHYEKFFEVFPEDVCQLFVAEYAGQVLAANIVIFFGGWAHYLHGGTANEHRDVMAPLYLQWQQILAAKERGCTCYDLGGVKVETRGVDASWDGITRFKRGFAPATQPLLFPGAYDIVIDKNGYQLYNRLRLLRQALVNFKKFFGQ